MAQRQFGVGGLGDEQRRQRHVNVGAVQIERVARGHHEAHHRLAATGLFHFFHQRWQGRFRRRGAQHQHQLGPEVTAQLEHRETAQPRHKAQNHHHKQQRRDVERAHQPRQVHERPQAELADGERHGAKRADGGHLHHNAHHLEHGGGEGFQKIQHRAARLTHHGQANAEQHRHQQHLQDVVAHKGADQRLGDDVQRKAGERHLVRLGHVALDGGLVQVCGVDVHARTGLHHVGHHQPHHQRQGGEEQEVRHGLAEDAAHGGELRHARDAGHDGQEDDRSDDHLHQLDEGIAQRLERFAIGRLKVAQQHAQDDGEHHLKVQLPVKRQLQGRSGWSGMVLHGGRVSKNHGAAPQGPPVRVEGAVCTAAICFSR